jgi:hypothetical protein
MPQERDEKGRFAHSASIAADKATAALRRQDITRSSIKTLELSDDMKYVKAMNSHSTIAKKLEVSARLSDAVAKDLRKSGRDDRLADDYVRRAEEMRRVAAFHKKAADAHAEAALQKRADEQGEIDWRPIETIPEDYYTYSADRWVEVNEQMRDAHGRWMSVESGCESAAEETMRNVETIHPKLLAATKSFKFVATPCEDDTHWAKVYNDPSFKAVATGGDGTVTVYNAKPVSAGIVAHECGHNLAKELWGTTTPGGEYAVVQREEMPVSPNATRNKAEDFAEACRLYSTNKQRLIAHFPKKYEALRRLLDG